MKTYYLIFFMFMVLNLAAQVDDYYYYHGEQIPLKINKDLRYLTSTDSIPIAEKIGNICTQTSWKALDQKELTWQIVSISDSVLQDNHTYPELSSLNQQILELNKVYAGPVIMERTPLPVSEYVYIQLKSTYPIEYLRDTITALNGSIIGPVPYSEPWYIIKSNPKTNAINLANRLFETKLVASAAPDFLFNFAHDKASHGQVQPFQYSPCSTEPNFTSQWGLQNIQNIDVKACAIWPLTLGNHNVVVGVLDTGIDPNHLEFSENLSGHSYNAQLNSLGQVSYDLHGTHVAGIIGANVNGRQITGFSPRVMLRSISHSLLANSPLFSSQIAAGINWATQNQVDVLNNSWGDQGGRLNPQIRSQILENALYNALFQGRNGLGTIVVFAAGNLGTVDYPGNYRPEILTVGSINQSGGLMPQSGTGSQLDVVAPGVNILSTLPNNGIGYLSGTSMAAPFASALSGLILSIKPELTRSEVVELIERSASKVGNFNYSISPNRPHGTWNQQTGYGLIDAQRLIPLLQLPSCSAFSQPVIYGYFHTNPPSHLTSSCNVRFENMYFSIIYEYEVRTNGYVDLVDDTYVNPGTGLTII